MEWDDKQLNSFVTNISNFHLFEHPTIRTFVYLYLSQTLKYWMTNCRDSDWCCSECREAALHYAGWDKNFVKHEICFSQQFVLLQSDSSHYSGSPMTVIVSSHRFVHCQIVKLSSLCQVSAVSMSTNRLVTRQQRSCHLWLLSKALNQNICISCLHMPIL